jgi:hypothetical protein
MGCRDKESKLGKLIKLGRVIFDNTAESGKAASHIWGVDGVELLHAQSVELNNECQLLNIQCSTKSDTQYIGFITHRFHAKAPLVMVHKMGMYYSTRICHKPLFVGNEVIVAGEQRKHTANPESGCSNSCHLSRGETEPRRAESGKQILYIVPCIPRAFVGTGQQNSLLFSHIFSLSLFLSLSLSLSPSLQKMATAPPTTAAPIAPNPRAPRLFAAPVAAAAAEVVLGQPATVGRFEALSQIPRA